MTDWSTLGTSPEWKAMMKKLRDGLFGPSTIYKLLKEKRMKRWSFRSGLCIPITAQDHYFTTIQQHVRENTVFYGAIEESPRGLQVNMKGTVYLFPLNWLDEIKDEPEQLNNPDILKLLSTSKGEEIWKINQLVDQVNYLTRIIS